MRAWIDVDNPPQVQYLLPFRDAFERVGLDTIVTARDHTTTLDLLRARGATFEPVGTSFGASKLRKVAGVAGRTLALARLLRRRGVPDLLVCSSRSSALAARVLGIPGFAILDYEFVDLRVFRLARTRIAHPDVIGPDAFVSRGIAHARLLPFAGLKEDISFAGVDVDTVPPHGFDGHAAGVAKILFRPPAEESHYYRESSGVLTMELLRHLSRREDATVVYSPRYERQGEYLSRFDWRRPPIVLRRPVPFVPLLKGVDAVVSSGGTMLREAAYLGVPAFSIFGGEIGGVDRYLESIGALTLIRSSADFDQIRGGAAAAAGHQRRPELVTELAATLVELAHRR